MICWSAGKNLISMMLPVMCVTQKNTRIAGGVDVITIGTNLSVQKQSILIVHPVMCATQKNTDMIIGVIGSDAISRSIRMVLPAISAVRVRVPIPTE